MKVNIIGGGIIGMSTAYQLSSAGVQVTVYEKDKTFNESSFARSCGGFRAQYFTKTNIEMSRYSINFVKQHTDIEFTGNGYLMLFNNEQRKDHDTSFKLQTSLGASTKSISPQEISNLYPVFTDDLYRGCITLDGSEGWIDPVTLHGWYKANASSVNIVYADGRDVNHDDADAVIITSGCWTGEVGKHFGLDIPVVPHKHTVFNVSTEKPVIKDLPLVADLTTGIYLRPEGNGYIVGYDGNGDLDSRDLNPDYNSWDRVWELLYHRFPDVFDAARMTGAWAGYYDRSTIDNNAIIDNDGKYYFATGFTGRGLMHSPAVGLLLSEMVLGKQLSFDIDAYKLNRTPDIEKYVI